jgi:hypothetical protein
LVRGERTRGARQDMKKGGSMLIISASFPSYALGDLFVHSDDWHAWMMNVQRLVYDSSGLNLATASCARCLIAPLLRFSCHCHLDWINGDIDRSVIGTGTKATSRLLCASKHTDSISSAMATMQVSNLHGFVPLTSREGLD